MAELKVEQDKAADAKARAARMGSKLSHARSNMANLEEELKGDCQVLVSRSPRHLSNLSRHHTCVAHAKVRTKRSLDLKHP